MADDDKRSAEEQLEALAKEIGDLGDMVTKKVKDQDENFRALREELTKSEKSAESEVRVKELADGYAEMTKEVQSLNAALNQVKREIDVPLLRGGKDLADSDRKAAIELQKRAFIHKGGDVSDFRADLDNLVDASVYRAAVRKMQRVGLESRDKVIRSLSQDERKAFEASDMDAGFFSPEMLGLEVECDPECASMVDLYDSVSVSKSTFQYPFIADYGALGEYGCDAPCDGPMGPEGNIKIRNGRVNDFRGAFCFQRNVLAEANYDLLSFMYRAIQRSHRINRNADLITGKDGWLTGNCFEARSASTAGVLTAQDYRMFLASAPMDYGPVTAVMHQNMFAYLISMPRGDGGFVFEDGALCVAPDVVNGCVRISNCLPDPTEGLTLGGAASPFAAGSFLMAAANWNSAYAAVEKRPIWIEQFEGGSSAWCVMYQFGAEDGGFVKCCNAGRVLTAA